MSSTKYPVSIEYINPMDLEASFTGGLLPPIFVDGDGHFYMYSSATDVYYPVRYNKLWEDSYPEHYHDQHQYCGHHPLINFAPSEITTVTQMKVGLENGSKTPIYSECPPIVTQILDEPWESYISLFYDRYYTIDGVNCPIDAA